MGLLLSANLAYLTCYFSIWYAIYKTVTVSSVVTQAKWRYDVGLENVAVLQFIQQLVSRGGAEGNLTFK